MTAGAMARRLHVTERAVRKMEESEAAETITLATLRRVAETLDCELHYALVPRTSIASTLLDQARTVAAKRLEPVKHSMLLEGQGEGHEPAHLVEILARDLLRGSGRDLW